MVPWNGHGAALHAVGRSLCEYSYWALALPCSVKGSAWAVKLARKSRNGTNRIRFVPFYRWAKGLDRKRVVKGKRGTERGNTRCVLLPVFQSFALPISPLFALAALVSALAEALSLWSPGMEMAPPYTLGAAAYANRSIGRSRCPAASKALHGLSTWLASRSTAQSASVSCPYPDGPRVCLRDQSYGFRRYREQPPDTSSIPAELSSD